MQIFKTLGKMGIGFSVLLLACSSTLGTNSGKHENPYSVPPNWGIAGSNPEEYDMGLDKGSGSQKNDAATIVSNTADHKGFGTLMQECIAYKYLGKRVKMTCYIKSKDVEIWAGMWLRVDPVRAQTSLAFDNMGNRPIKGTTSWKKCEIVLDIPTNAALLAYGVLLVGKGQVWFENFSFEEVDKNTAITGTPLPPLKDALLQEPSNLRFQE